VRDAPPWFEEYTDGNNRGIKLDIAVGAQIDMTAATDAVLIAGQMPHSVPSQAFDGNLTPLKYAIYSTGGWPTRNTIITPDGATDSQAGVVSDIISNGDREIDWECDIEFTEEHQSGLTIYFQDNMIAEDFDITVNDAVVQTDGGGGTEPPTPQSGLKWSVTGGVLSITSADPLEYIVIPDYEEGGAPWYPQRANITSVNITVLIVGIGINAFYGLDKLISVVSMGSSIYISAGAFKGCRSLPSVTIPASVGEIFGTAFDGCTGLQSITVQGSPQIYAGAFSLGTYDDLAECALAGVVVNDAYGNRYTKLWQNTLGVVASDDNYDNCYRIFGDGSYAVPAQPPYGRTYDEMLIFDRITGLTGGGANWALTTTAGTVNIGSIFMGDSLVNIDAIFSPKGPALTSIRNGDATAKIITRAFLVDSVYLTSGRLKIDRFTSMLINSGNIEGSMTNSAIPEIILTHDRPDFSTDTNFEAYKRNIGRALNGAINLRSLTGPGVEGGMLYYNSSPSVTAVLAVNSPPTVSIIFKSGTTDIGVGSTTPIVANVDTVDIPDSLKNKANIKGDCDTVICRCARSLMPGFLNAYNSNGTLSLPTAPSPLTMRRAYFMAPSAGKDASSGGGTSTDCVLYRIDKLEILDMVGGTDSGDQIAQYEFYMVPNLQEIRIRSHIVSNYASMYRIRTSGGSRTYNVYSYSGLPRTNNNVPYVAFVRVGDPPPREVV